MKTDLKEPCAECPFRKNSLPGWLGPWEPQELLDAIPIVPFPCHKTISDDMSFADSRLAKMQSCAGAVLFLRNKSQIPRNRDMAAHGRKLKDMPDCEEKQKDVFETQQEFITHHTEIAWKRRVGRKD